MYSRLLFKRKKQKKIAYDPVLDARERSGSFWGMSSKRMISDETPNEFLSRWRGTSSSSKDLPFLLMILGLFGFIMAGMLFLQFGWPVNLEMALTMFVFIGLFIAGVISFIRLMMR
jgi:hypothetical protein